VSEAPTLRDGSTDGGVPWMVERFVVEHELGAGGMGRVYLAYDPSLDRQVAIKLLRDDPAVDVERAHVRMAREARAMARLRHPNVATVHEVGTHDGQVFIVMEYVAGGTLRDWVTDARPWQRIVEMYVRAGRGLEAAHAAGLVHRDFKPDNVLVERDTDRVLVSDFGIAAVYGDDLTRSADRDEPASVTRTGTKVGTPPYMSPEQHRAQPADARADQFSFCAALYEALFGARPFAGNDLDTIADNAIHHRITPPRIDRKVGTKITAAIERGLAADAAARFPSMTELLRELEIKPRRGWWIAVAAAAAIAAGAIVWLVREPIATVTCDCERFTVTAPAGLRIVGWSAVPPIGTAMRAPASGPTLAIPRGPHTIDYEANGVVYSLAVMSNGIDTKRAIALPVPVTRAGFVFVPGGEVPVGDLAHLGDRDERVGGTVKLEPYLIAKREEPELVTFERARAIALDHKARLPTAAEWEWAARLGVIDHALANAWEWTATRYAPYPYDVERDDPFATGTTIEVRGGQIDRCDTGDGRNAPCDGDPPRVTRRFEGQRIGEAELRLARTAVPAESVRIRVDTREVDPHDLAKLRRFVIDNPVALRVTANSSPSCSFFGAIPIVDRHAIELVLDRALPADIVELRPHPNPAFRGEGRVSCSDTSIEILDVLCFDADNLLTRSSDPLIASIADSLAGNKSIKKVEVGDWVQFGTGDALAVSERRAKLVRTRLIAAGIAANRLVTAGYGAESEEESKKARRAALLQPGACVTGGHVQLLILERSGDP
jgi:predicted Ser/Thr protein kinase